MVHAQLQHVDDVGRLVDGPGIDDHVQLVGLFHPFGMLVEDGIVVVDAGNAYLVQFGRRDFPAQILDAVLRHQTGKFLTGGKAEGDELHAFGNAVTADGLHAGRQGDRFVFRIPLALEFENQLHLRILLRSSQVFVEGRDDFAVGQAERVAAQRGKRSFIDGESLVREVVVDHELPVSGQVDVEFGAVGADASGGEQGSEGILGGAFGLPETAVGHNLRPFVFAAGDQQAARQQIEEEAFHKTKIRIMRVADAVFVILNYYKYICGIDLKWKTGSNIRKKRSGNG